MRRSRTAKILTREGQTEADPLEDQRWLYLYELIQLLKRAEDMWGPYVAVCPNRVTQGLTLWDRDAGLRSTEEVKSLASLTFLWGELEVFDPEFPRGVQLADLLEEYDKRSQLARRAPLASEIVRILQQAIREHGDLPVYLGLDTGQD